MVGARRTVAESLVVELSAGRVGSFTSRVASRMQMPICMVALFAIAATRGRLRCIGESHAVARSATLACSALLPNRSCLRDLQWRRIGGVRVACCRDPPTDSRSRLGQPQKKEHFGIACVARSYLRACRARPSVSTPKTVVQPAKACSTCYRSHAVELPPKTAQPAPTTTATRTHTLPATEADKAARPLLDKLQQAKQLARDVKQLEEEAQLARCEAALLFVNCAGRECRGRRSRHVSVLSRSANTREAVTCEQTLEKRMQRGCGALATGRPGGPAVAPSDGHTRDRLPKAMMIVMAGSRMPRRCGDDGA